MNLALASCTVRSWAPADAPSTARHANNRRVWLNLRDVFPHPYTLADAEAFLGFCAAERPESSFALAVDGQAVGAVGLKLGEDVHRHTAELGYWRSDFGLGYGVPIVSDAVKGFSAWAFEEFDLLRVFAMPYAHNRASARVLEKAGYEREGYLRQHAVKDGQILDVLLYAKLRP